MSRELTTEVLIVGAGPTGLMAANQLKRFGVDFIIVDSKSGPTAESRAILLTARSLEIYHQMGLSDQVVENGKRIPSFNLYSNGKKKGSVEIGKLGKGLSEFGYLLAFEQSKNERLLSEQLQASGQPVLWGHEYVEMLEHETRILAKIRNGAEELIINAEYIIGCEGARSPIRHELNFSFKGGTYEQKFFVADAVLDWDLTFDKLIVSPGKENFCALMPITDTNSYRLLGTLPKKFSAKEEVTFVEIEEVFKRTLNIKMEIKEVNWFATYKLHHRAVSHFSEGKVFLAGDSAHIHSPAGGQGMNTGLQDAYNLAWKLAMVLKKQSPEKLLKTYNEERLPYAKSLLKFTDRGFTMMSSTNWFVKFIRTFFMLPIAGLLMKNRRLRPIAFKTLSQIGYSYKKESISQDLSKQKINFSAGDRFPYFENENLYNKFRAPSFHYLHVGKDIMTEEEKVAIQSIFPAELVFVEDQNLEKWNKLGMEQDLYVLVRPDNYIALISDLADASQLEEYLKKVGLKS